MIMKWNVALAALVVVSFTFGAALDLGGEWTVKGDGLEGRLMLPGTLSDAKLGDEQSFAKWDAVDNRLERFALRAQYRYIGKAVYARTVEVSADLAAKPLELVLERVLWTSSVKVDGRDKGTRDSLGTPHVYAFAPGELKPGAHTFEITVDNTCHYSFTGWSHSWGPTTQTRWNGILGEFALREAHPLRAARVFAPWPANGAFQVEVPSVCRLTPANVRVDGLSVTACSRTPSPYAAGRDLVTVRFTGEAAPWSDHHPRLYTLTLTDGAFARTLKFGFRTFERRGNRLYLNGTPIWLRGDVDNCQFPYTGYPPVTVAEWRRQIRIQQLNGCNGMGFHTWTPPAAAFAAADELGFLLFCEVGYWCDGWMEAGACGRGNVALDDFLHRELFAILDAYGDHPSFLTICMGNELGNSDFNLMGGWMAEAKKYDPRHLAFASTARQITPADDLMVTHNYPSNGVGSVRCWRRPHTDWDYETAYAKAPLPVIAHEIGQWPVYPMWNMEIPKYDGLLRPYDWMALRDLAAKNGTLKYQRRWHTASLKTNRLMYKDEVESFLRTPSCAGLQLLDIRDYTGQGEAFVGWLDAFFDAKPALSELPAFSDVMRDVPFLARFAKYTWTVGETFTAKLQIRNLTDQPIPAGTAYPWRFAGRSGWAKLAADLAPYEIATLETLTLPLTDDLALSRQTLVFGENRWSVWVYPAAADAAPVPAGVLVTADISAAAAALVAGGRVVWTGTGEVTGQGKFEPVYWSSIHFPSKDPAMMIGTWFAEDHPAFAHFPTEDWMDWQWRSLTEKCTVHVLRGLPETFEPIAAPVSDLHLSEPLATIFELAVGKGRLLVCGYPIAAPKTPEARALRASLFAYAASDAFRPYTTISVEEFRRRFTKKASANRQLKSGVDYVVTRDKTTLTLTVKNAKPVQGSFAVSFVDHAPLEGTFEGRPCRLEKLSDGTCRLVAQMNREDALDGKFEFTCRVATGYIPRLGMVECRAE